MKTDHFQSCGHWWVFQTCWHMECSTLTAPSFRIWNSSTGIPSPPLALIIVMLPKAHLILGMQGFFSFHKSISLTYHINKLKKKNHMIIWKDTEKIFDKIQHSFIIKTLQKVGTERTYLNIINAHMTNSQLISSLLKVTSWKCSLKIKNKIRMSTLITFIQHSFGSPSHGQRRKIILYTQKIIKMLSETIRAHQRIG